MPHPVHEARLRKNTQHIRSKNLQIQHIISIFIYIYEQKPTTKNFHKNYNIIATK